MVHIEALFKGYATHVSSIYFGGKNYVFASQMEPLHSILKYYVVLDASLFQNLNTFDTVSA